MAGSAGYYALFDFSEASSVNSTLEDRVVRCGRANLIQGQPGSSAEPRPRVALLTPSLGAGGAERQILTLARELRRSHDVRIFVLRSGGLFEAAATELGVEIHALGLSQKPFRKAPLEYTVSLLRALLLYIRLSRTADVVDAWMATAYGFAALAQPLARVPVIVAGRRAMWITGPGRPPWKRRVGSFAIRRFDAVVTNCVAIARGAVLQAGVRPDRVHVIRNGVYPPAQPAHEERQRLRRAWGLGDDRLLVGSVANYRPGKGVETILEVADRLRTGRPELRYILVGDGPVRPALERRIAELRLGDIVRLHGAHPDAWQLYPAFDIVIHASASEGLPNVILEAAAWGKPIVATDVGGVSEVVRDRREALLVPPGDSAALAAALLELVLDPALCERLAAAARGRVLEFTPERLAAETAGLYGALFATRRRRAEGAPRTPRRMRRPSG
jgi:glycosyltransferase involved in cell wall biosynthesis